MLLFEPSEQLHALIVKISSSGKDFCLSVWGYDKRIITFWIKATFTCSNFTRFLIDNLRVQLHCTWVNEVIFCSSGSHFPPTSFGRWASGGAQSYNTKHVEVDQGGCFFTCHDQRSRLWPRWYVNFKTWNILGITLFGRYYTAKRTRVIFSNICSQLPP